MSQLANQRIAVLKGGPGSERAVSLAAAGAIASALREAGAAEVVEVDVKGPGFELPGGDSAFDIAFNNIHGTYGEDGQLQRELEDRGVRYTGERVAGSELAFDKIATKERFVKAGVDTPAYQIVGAGEIPSMPLPYVIKAPREGSSVGIFIVKTPEEVAPAVEAAAKFGKQLLVEEFIPGRELTVSILGGTALPIIEIRPRQGFYDFANKYPFLDPEGKGAADHFCPAPLDEALTARVQQMALEANKALGLEFYCRVDFLLREDGRVVVLEVNTIPGMTTASLLPEAAAAVGISFPQLCERIVQLSLP